MSDTKPVIDCSTGDVEQVPLTPEEIAMRDFYSSQEIVNPVSELIAQLPGETLEETNEILMQTLTLLEGSRHGY